MPAGARKVDRTTPWGNPFDYRGPGRDRAVAICEYTAWLDGEGPDELPAGHRVFSRSWVLEHLDELAGARLACWCPLDGPCHSNVLGARVYEHTHRASETVRKAAYGAISRRTTPRDSARRPVGHGKTRRSRANAQPGPPAG
jgi:hypothetical protein